MIKAKTILGRILIISPIFCLLFLGIYLADEGNVAGLLLVFGCIAYMMIILALFSLPYPTPPKSCYTCKHNRRQSAQFVLCDVLGKYVHPLGACQFYEEAEKV